MFDKTQIRVCDLSNEHLINIGEMLKVRFGNATGTRSVAPQPPVYGDYGHAACYRQITEAQLWDPFLTMMWNGKTVQRALVAELVHRSLLDKIRILEKKLFGAWAVWKRTKGSPAGQVHLGSFMAYAKEDLEKVLKHHRLVVAMNRPNVEIVVKALTENQAGVAKVLDASSREYDAGLWEAIDPNA